MGGTVADIVSNCPPPPQPHHELQPFHFSLGLHFASQPMRTSGDHQIPQDRLTDEHVEYYRLRSGSHESQIFAGLVGRNVIEHIHTPEKVVGIVSLFVCFPLVV